MQLHFAGLIAILLVSGTLSSPAIAGDLIVRHRSVALPGDPVPGTPFTLGPTFGGRPLINDRGQVLFSAQLEGPGFPAGLFDATTPPAVLRAESDGSVVLVVRVGQELFGETVTSVQPLAINNKGHVLVRVVLGKDHTNWLLLWKSSAAIEPVIHDDQVIEGGAFCGFVSSPNSGRPLLNDRDEVLFLGAIRSPQHKGPSCDIQVVIRRERNGKLTIVTMTGQSIGSADSVAAIFTDLDYNLFWPRLSLNRSGRVVHRALTLANQCGSSLPNAVVFNRCNRTRQVLHTGDPLPDSEVHIGCIYSAFLSADSVMLSTVRVPSLHARAIVRVEGATQELIAIEDQALPFGESFFSLGSAIENSAGRLVFNAKVFDSEGDIDPRFRTFIKDRNSDFVEIVRPGTAMAGDIVMRSHSDRLPSVSKNGSMAAVVSLEMPYDDEIRGAYALISAALKPVPIVITGYDFNGYGTVSWLAGPDQYGFDWLAIFSNGEDGISEINDDGEFVFSPFFDDQTGGVFTAQLIETCTGDVNGDGVVSFVDLFLVIFAFGVCDGCNEDLNDDGLVDYHDLVIVVLNLGACD